MKINDGFRWFSHQVSEAAGSPWAFIGAVAVVVAWGCLGPMFHYSDTWQLVINTSTTIVTFLMVFLIQNTQNRDATAVHLKLDELLRGVEGARTGLVDLEHLSDDELKRLQLEFKRLRKEEGLNVSMLEAGAAETLKERTEDAANSGDAT